MTSDADAAFPSPSRRASRRAGPPGCPGSTTSTSLVKLRGADRLAHTGLRLGRPGRDRRPWSTARPPGRDASSSCTTLTARSQAWAYGARPGCRAVPDRHSTVRPREPRPRTRSIAACALHAVDQQAGQGQPRCAVPGDPARRDGPSPTTPAPGVAGRSRLRAHPHLAADEPSGGRRGQPPARRPGSGCAAWPSTRTASPSRSTCRSSTRCWRSRSPTTSTPTARASPSSSSAARGPGPPLGPLVDRRLRRTASRPRRRPGRLGPAATTRASRAATSTTSACTATRAAAESRRRCCARSSGTPRPRPQPGHPRGRLRLLHRRRRALRLDGVEDRLRARVVVQGARLLRLRADFFFRSVCADRLAGTPRRGG